MRPHTSSANRSPAALSRERLRRKGPRPRRLLVELLEDRRMLALAPLLVDLQPASDSGLYDNDNLTNVRTAVIDITAAQPGDAVRIYRGSSQLGQAEQIAGAQYRYTFAADQLLEGPNTITARSFDGAVESGDSPPLVITLDTAGPRITSSAPASLVNLRTTTLDSATVTFNEPIDDAPVGGTFTTADVTITGPAGQIAATSIAPATGNQYRLTFPAQNTRGAYRITVGPNVADLAGNPMDQDNDGSPGEATQDQYTFTITAIDADTIFTTPTTIAEGNTTYDGQHIVINATTVTINGPHTFGSVHLINGATLTHTANTASQTYKLDLTVGEQIIVDDASRIDVTGKGYLPGRTTGNTAVSGATGNSGGSYGGLGAIYSGVTNRAYGDYAEPNDWGSGGSTNWSSEPAGSGGGLVRITAATLQLDGRLSAGGAGAARGGGSGGGIWISVTTLAGGGSLMADGGNGYAGGGGGRVAVYAADYSQFAVNAITAQGGTGASHVGSGGAGTVYVVEGIPYLRILSHSPAGTNGGLVPSSVDHVLIEFNKRIQEDTLESSHFVIDGQMGRVQPTNITKAAGRTYRIDFSPLTENGPYHFTLLPAFLDTDGFALDENRNRTPGEPEDAFSWRITVDTIPPRVTRHSPAGDVAGTVSSIDIWFSERVDKTTFTTADVSIVNPGGQAVTVSGVQEVGLNRFRISFPAQTALGMYQVNIGPGIADLAGNLLD